MSTLRRSFGAYSVQNASLLRPCLGLAFSCVSGLSLRRGQAALLLLFIDVAPQAQLFKHCAWLLRDKVPRLHAHKTNVVITTPETLGSVGV